MSLKLENQLAEEESARTENREEILLLLEEYCNKISTSSQSF